MKAAVCTAYGGPQVVAVRDLADPLVKPDEVLIRVHATTVASGDARIRGSRFPSGFWLPARLMFGLARPRKAILGTECAGIVEQAGSRVTRYQPGDRVFAFSGAKLGCHAELVAMRQDGPIAPIPDGYSFEEAAAISFGGTTALYFLRDLGKLIPGERVLVNGASGAVGTALVQLARHLGAHVTGVCSADHAELVRSLGAHEVIDYRSEDFARRGARWDMILDVVGTAPFARCSQALTENGRLLLVVAGLGDMLKAPLQSRTGGRRVLAGTAPDRAGDIVALKGLCEAGAYRPVIDSCYPLERIVEAHARVDTGHKAGSVVVTIPIPT